MSESVAELFAGLISAMGENVMDAVLETFAGA